MFFYNFSLMIEGSGSGSVTLTNGSGSRSRRSLNIRILRIRIRIRNTGISTMYGMTFRIVIYTYPTFSWPPQDKNRSDARSKELAGSPSLFSKKSASRKSPILVPLSRLGWLGKEEGEGAGGSVLHIESGAQAVMYDRRRLPLLDRKLLLASGVLVQEYR
jgi:hypothetical protein